MSKENPTGGAADSWLVMYWCGIVIGVPLFIYSIVVDQSTPLLISLFVVITSGVGIKGELEQATTVLTDGC